VAVPDDPVYAHGHDDAVLRSHRRRTAADSAAHLVPHLRPGMSLLDVGCGPGTVTAGLARLVAPGRVVGIDPEPRVLDEARSQAPGVDFVAADLAGFDPGGERFDVVHAHQVLHHLADPVAALRTMAGLAVPGGLVAAREADWAAMTWWPADPRLDRWLALFRHVLPADGLDAGRRLLAWALDAGLEDVRYTTSSWTFATPEDRAWWGETWAERTTGSGLAERAVADGLATADELADVAAGWRAWAADPGAVFVVLHGEVIARAPAR
jgi:SAM-dependent methyltransferase